ncbi:MAG: DUF3267 domain-containing protein [Anaerolineaceae bacterium]
MNATRTLPEDYRPVATFDLKTDRRLLLILNGASLAVAYLFYRLSLAILPWLRPEVTFSVDLNDAGIDKIMLAILVLLVIVTVTILLHESIHGLFFWIFTRSKPEFAFKGAYAYAKVPGWYLRRNAYLTTGLAPLVLITLLGFILLKFVIPEWLPGVLVAIVFNAAGAVGDIAVAIWLLTQPKECLAADDGDAVTLFVPETLARK